MNLNPEPTTVGALVARLRKMLGHTGKRDKQTVFAAIEAILELSERNAELEGRKRVAVDVNPLSPHHITPRHTMVIEKIEEPTGV